MVSGKRNQHTGQYKPAKGRNSNKLIYADDPEVTTLNSANDHDINDNVNDVSFKLNVV